MKKFTQLKTTAVVIGTTNIDTDQIIGSDHLKITDKIGLGKHLFSDWRYLKNGQENESFTLNKEETRYSKVLIAGDNFGCGSSREHAPWAILDFGIEVVISSSIADIFFNNSIKNGLLPIKVTSSQHEFLLNQNANMIEVDLVQQKIVCNDEVIPFELESFARYCLLNGLEQLDYLQSHLEEINQYEENNNNNFVGVSNEI